MEKEYGQIVKMIEGNLTRCLLGKRDEIKLIMTALFAGGHVLIEGVPGTGKTMLVKALAKSIQGDFRRVQCNPDLLPTDITGFSMYHPKEEKFVFQSGPVMTNILLVDEINRASTKTQSALLEAMEEKQVTVDGMIYPLPQPFLVMATQNPIEFEGTYLLPEAQLDRFMMKLNLTYPDAKTEKELLISQSEIQPLDALTDVTDMDSIEEMQRQVKTIHVDEGVVDYILKIIRNTREHKEIFLGASSRSGLSLMIGVKSLAFINGRKYVTPDDVKFLAPYVLSHRIILTQEARMDSITVESIIQSIVGNVKVPIRLEK